MSANKNNVKHSLLHFYLELKKWINRYFQMLYEKRHQNMLDKSLDKQDIMVIWAFTPFKSNLSLCGTGQMAQSNGAVIAGNQT